MKRMKEDEELSDGFCVLVIALLMKKSLGTSFSGFPLFLVLFLIKCTSRASFRSGFDV